MFSVHTKPEKLENAKNHQRYVFQKKCFASTLKLYFDVFNTMQEFYTFKNYCDKPTVNGGPNHRNI